jgi:hypothetical protein
MTTHYPQTPIIDALYTILEADKFQQFKEQSYDRYTNYEKKNVDTHINEMVMAICLDYDSLVNAKHPFEINNNVSTVIDYILDKTLDPIIVD